MNLNFSILTKSSSTSRLTHHYLHVSPTINMRQCALNPSSISTLRAFFLFCAVLFQLEVNVPMFCVCAQINHSHPRFSLLSFILPYKAVYIPFFVVLF